MKKILILQASSAQALAIAKFLKKFGRFYIVGCIENTNSFFKRNYYDEIIRVYDYSTINFANYDYILPTGAKSTFNILKKEKELYYEYNIIFKKNNLIAFDKIKMLQIVSNLGIPIPDTYYTINEIKKFPIFFKEKIERGGGRRGIAYSFKDIPKRNNDLIYQEFIKTPYTYGVGFLAKNGRIIAYYSHRELLSYPLFGGTAVAIENYFHKDLLIYTQKIVKKLNYNGWGLIEFKYCKRRKSFVFMELNAKFWASIELTLANNPLFLKYLFNVDYKPLNIKKILFIDRLFKLNSLDIIKYLYIYRDFYFVNETPIIYLLLNKIIPNQIKQLVKRYIK